MNTNYTYGFLISETVLEGITMPYNTEEERRDFARQIVNLLKTNAEKLKSQGYDPESKIVELTRLHETAEQAEADQRNAEAAHRAATRASQESTEAAYKGASATIDLVVGLVGKDDELAKAMRSMRK